MKLKLSDPNFSNNFFSSFSIKRIKFVTSFNPLLDNSIGSNWSASNVLMNNGDYVTPGFDNQFKDCINNGDINSALLNISIEKNIQDIVAIM